jgi:hypothetical protein
VTILQIPDEPVENWLADLKPYQRTTLQEFLKTGTPDEAAEAWLTSIGSKNIAGFGGQPGGDPKPYWDRLKAECRRFICDENAYVEEKKALIAELPLSKTVLISVISSAMGATLGTAGTLIAPPVTLLLFAAGKMGLNAYCAN